MECFNHPGAVAVCQCRGCGKGICRNCALPISRGLVCSEDCRDFAESALQFQAATLRSKGMLSAARFTQPLMALIFIGSGLYTLLLQPPYMHFLGWLMLALGLPMCLSVLLTHLKRRRSSV
ncbi:MAG: hypothetical protein GAK45_01746 [Pseudomonas citronellolis]|nr:MAG: hypothetical protein GAK45_01746 [Pseudomonas citronellolis]